MEINRVKVSVYNMKSHPSLYNRPTIYSWYMEGVVIKSHTQSVIGIHIPGVNQQDRIIVNLTLLDRLRGIKIQDKTWKVFEKWEGICHEKNKELEYFHELGQKIIGNKINL
ncbi:hypothetical protein [Paenibacillus polymyxa]|uniref:hypothetical protein n=1 Tax=Paenibacillus polymyxa TaxID=1406 RepID=UPI0003D2B406|nr:hypothetical protein [Paenibacillus polymyxa]AIW41796.1 hypothetical protein X809_38625 [Paenibacillus polymyxa CR1]